MTDIALIAQELNRRAAGHAVGRLADIRKLLPGNRRTLPELFPAPNVNPDKKFAFHHGGRKELQGNVGFELVHGLELFRHGVAFSLETSTRFFDPDVRKHLFPRISRFNDYVRECAGDFYDMRMWYWDGASRHSEWPVAPIPHELKTVGFFIALGKLQRPEHIDFELVLNDLDRLLPLYEYVEGGAVLGSTSVASSPEFVFSSGHNRDRKKTASATWPTLSVEVNLHHNTLQDWVHEHLIGLHGKDNVGTELTAGHRKRIDAVVKQAGGCVLCEIKTSFCIELCLREALSQLIEYSYWVKKAGEQVSQLVVVSENRSTPESRGYLHYLVRELGLPVVHKRIDNRGFLHND